MAGSCGSFLCLVVGLFFLLASVSCKTESSLVDAHGAVKLQTFADWQQSPTYHLRVLRRTRAIDASKDQEVCVVLSAHYGQIHRGVSARADDVLFFTSPSPT